MRGGEWCLDVFCELLPEATLFTLLHLPGRVSKRIESMKIRTSFIGNLPGARSFHQRYLPLFPFAIERFDLSGFDFVLSSSHCVAKGAAAGRGRRHVCYCHTPMRYVWEFYDDYFAAPRTGRLTRLLMPRVAESLRRWDARTASRVDRFVANSAHIASRIQRAYGREAEVVHPPVDVARFRSDLPREDYFLVLSALVPYKKVE
ncbi:MAG: glycosyltransferase, partial [Candidatus Eisenbacteria bacterium]|nr:glycosyltransferase [Candidatus Eisenbacteria bacterium]